MAILNPSFRAPASIARVRELPALLLLVFIIVWLAATRPAFRAPANLAQVSQETAQLGILACGDV